MKKVSKMDHQIKIIFISFCNLIFMVRAQPMPPTMPFGNSPYFPSFDMQPRNANSGGVRWHSYKQSFYSSKGKKEKVLLFLIFR